MNLLGSFGGGQASGLNDWLDQAKNCHATHVLYHFYSFFVVAPAVGSVVQVITMLGANRTVAFMRPTIDNIPVCCKPAVNGVFNGG